MKVEREAHFLAAPATLLFTGFLGVPLAMTLVLSFHEWSLSRGIVPTFGLQNYVQIFTDNYFAAIFFRTFRLSILVTAICILVGVPEAYILRRMNNPWRSILVVVVIGPLLISLIARTLGWVLILSGSGLISQVLMALGLTSGPVSLVYTETGVVIAMTHVLVPLMVLSVWASLGRMDPATAWAAQSLGAGQFTIFRKIVLPQAMPGILSGSIIVFTLMASSFATPAIIGGRRLKVASMIIYDEFLNTLNWPLGAAIAVLLLVGIVLVILGWNRFVERRYAQVFSS